MDSSDSLARALERITELEIKASYAEDSVDQLNMSIYRQQQQIDALLAEVRYLREQMPAEGAGVARSDELPPHY